MDLIKDLKLNVYRIVGKLRPSRRPRPIALESSALGILPHELILAIASFLPPESIPAFSLSCRPIHFILGMKPLADKDIYSSLKLLERDLPKHVLCYHCKKFHAIGEARRYSQTLWGAHRNISRPCLKANCEYFSFVIFQMTMKVHRQGLSTRKLLSLLSHGWPNLGFHDYVEQRTASARIVAGSLLFRQRIVFVNRFQAPSSRRIQEGPYVRICPHIHFGPAKGFDRYHYNGDDRLVSGTKDYRNLKGLILRCRHCHTEFEVKFSGSGKKDDLMTITTWKDFGEGRSFSDIKFRRHLYESYSDYFWGRLPPIKYGWGESVSALFEGREYFECASDAALSPSILYPDHYEPYTSRYAGIM